MSGTTSKIRLVRCPKCRGILPELPNLQVYQCGGCGATLRAKIRKGEGGNSETPAAVNPAQTNQNASAEIPTTSAVQNQSGSSETPETDHPVGNNQSATSETPDTSPKNNLSGSSATHDTNPAQNKKFKPASIAKELACSSQDVNKFPTEASEQVEYAGNDKEHTGSTNFSNRISFPGELNCHGKKELFESAVSCETDGNNEKAFTQRSPSSGIQLVCGGSVPTYTAQRALSKSLPAHTENSSANEQLEQSQKIVCHDSDYAMPRDAVKTTEDSIILDEDNIIVDEGKLNSKNRDALIENISQSTQNSPPEEKLTHSQKIVRRDSDRMKSKDEVVKITERIMSENDAFSNRCRCLLNERSSSQAYKFSTEQQLELSQGIMLHNSDHERSHKITECNVVSEEDLLINRLGDVSKSSTTRCSFDYDASVSSNDGLEDQISDQHAHIVKCVNGVYTKGTSSEFVGAKDGPTSDYIQVIDKKNLSTDVRSFSSLPLNKEQGPVVMDKDTDRNQDMLLDHNRYGIEEKYQIKLDDFQGLCPTRNRMGLEKDIGKRFYGRGMLASQENGGFSNYGKKDFLHASDFLSPHEMDYVEHNQVELLRKVDELRDQLNRSFAPRGNANGRFPAIGTHKKHPLPAYHNVEQSELQVLQFNDAKYPWHPSGADFGYSYWHSYPEEQQRSLQVLPPNCYNKCQCRVHPIYRCSYAPCSSSHSGPQQHTSNFPGRWSYYSGPLPRTQGHMEHKVNNSYHKERERRNPIKQHFRPIAGGAPFVTCYSCSKLLHLPADFVLSHKRCHKLRCGSCSKVLLFSLNSRTSVPSAIPIMPPPSRVDSCSSSRGSNVNTRKRYGFKSCADDSFQGNEVSYSEDYCPSILRNSCSTEDEIELLTPASSSHTRPSNGVDRKHPSPLHRLMGYSSPGEMIRGSAQEQVLKRGPERTSFPSMDA